MHHFNLLTLQHSQDGIITEQSLIKNYTYYVFDTECIQEVDKFTINIDIFTTQTECLNTIQQDLLPISIMIPKYTQDVTNQKVFTALFDSGGTISLIHEHVLMTNIKTIITKNLTFTTLAGKFQSNRQVLLQDIILPEFKRTAYMNSQACQVIIGTCSYNIILGQDFLRKVQFNINFDNNTMNCMDTVDLWWFSVVQSRSDVINESSCRAVRQRLSCHIKNSDPSCLEQKKTEKVDQLWFDVLPLLCCFLPSLSTSDYFCMHPQPFKNFVCKN